MRHWLLIAGCLGALATADLAAAQGSIARGKVVDEQGSPVAGASVTFHDAENDRTYASESDSNGEFVIVVRPTRYEITVEKDGFRGARFEYGIRRRGETELPAVEIVSARTIMDAALGEINRQLEEAAALAEAGKLAEAQAVYEELLRERPDVAEAHYNLGVLLIRKGELEPAAGALERALELRPDHGPVAVALAGVYEEGGRGEEAAAVIEKAAGEHPDDPGIQIGAAYFHLRADRREAARPYLERVRALEPEHAEAHYLLATVAAGQGEIAEAVELLERFLQLADADDRYRAAAEEMLPGLKQYLASQQSAEREPQP